MQSKKLDYALLALLFGAGYGLVKYALPDVPLNEESSLALLLYILAKLGLEVVGAPVAGLFKK